MLHYDPNDVGKKNGNIFSLEHNYDSSEIILLPIPWDATVSYKDGTCQAPMAILEASSQLDFHHPSGAKIWEYGVHMLPINEEWIHINKETRQLAKLHIDELEQNDLKVESSPAVNTVNKNCADLKEWAFNECDKLLNDEKKIGVIGGDHSCALGIIEALSKHHDNFGILQLDAHADLRETYENFTYSHASIMHNSLLFNNIFNLSQVSVRDVSPKEANRIKSDQRIQCHYDWAIKEDLFNGKTWHSICLKIIETLPSKVYISFDIDSLQPSLCPNTGTPVPGGLSYSETIYLIQILVESGRTIIGFDLSEVGVNSSSDWDANVGARILFNLCNAMHNSYC